jgi:AraC-like DNA-binding protein
VLIHLTRDCPQLIEQTSFHPATALARDIPRINVRSAAGWKCRLAESLCPILGLLSEQHTGVAENRNRTMQIDRRCLSQEGHRSSDCQVAFRRWVSLFIPELNFTETTEHDVAYGAHVHDVMEIIWVLSGCARLICRDRSYTMQRGDAVIIMPNEVHAGGSYERCSFSFATLHIPRTVLELLCGCQYAREYMAPVQLLDRSLAEILYRNLIGGLPDTLSLADQLTCLDDGLGKLFKAKRSLAFPAVPLMECHPAVKRAKSIINATFTESIDFCRLAAEVNLHQRYLISLFKTMTGIPPHQYQIALRVDLARRLLDYNLPLCSVASSAGFADQSHFNRHFKRIYSLTPGAFREQTTPR